MSRPNYPNCVMTPGVIRGVQQRQRAYDKDPDAYEKRERQQKENYEREQEEMSKK